MQVLLNLLYFYGMCDIVKECLLQRYFSKELRSGIHGGESDVIEACQRVRKFQQFVACSVKSACDVMPTKCSLCNVHD